MKDNKGSVVLYAVFLMMALSATAMATAFTILSAIRFTGNSTRAASAFYAAESGIEQGLYEIKQHRDDRAIIIDALSASTIADTTLDNGAIYSTVATNDYKTEISFDLPLYSSKQIDIFDPDTGESLFLSGPGSLSFSWDNYVFCDMEVSINEFTNATIISGPTITNYIYNSGNVLSLTKDYSYKIKIKPLTCDLENVTVEISSEYDDIYFPNYIRIISTGEMGIASFPMQAETIWKPPLSGLGEFVLFSEEEIIK